MKNKNNITSFEDNTSKWYTDLVLKSELISYGPVKGTMFFRPYGYKIWLNIQRLLTIEFEKLNVEEVKFPLLFPESFLAKEKDHIDGFAPEVLTVTRVGNNILEEPLIIRPTSETLFGTYFSENLSTYSQLPVKLNQWVNIMRWENNTRPFLRNSEFFWQEGHTVHSTKNEAKIFSKEIHSLYEKFVNDVLLLPVISGEKTVSERFAGAENTYTIESILKDGQSLQSGTSHYLGNKFSKSFNIRVQGFDNKFFNPFQTSWGVSTRLIGALIMTHSDNYGLILPSKIAPYTVVIMTLFSDKEPKVLELAEKLKSSLSGPIMIDSSTKHIGHKAKYWEIKGVPIRIEIGPKDVEQRKVLVSVRNGKQKIGYNFEDITNDLITNLLIDYDKQIFLDAKKIKDEKYVEINSIKEINDIIKLGKYCSGYWTEDSKQEQEIKLQTGATIRCLVKSSTKGKSINSDEETSIKAIFARSY